MGKLQANDGLIFCSKNSGKKLNLNFLLIFINNLRFKFDCHRFRQISK